MIEIKRIDLGQDPEEIKKEIATWMQNNQAYVDKYVYARLTLSLPSYLADEYAWGEPIEEIKVPQTLINADIVIAIWASGILPAKPKISGVSVTVSKSRCDRLREVAVSVMGKYSSVGEYQLNLISESGKKGLEKNYGPNLYETLSKYNINCVDPYQPSTPIGSSIRDIARGILIKAGILQQGKTLYDMKIPDDIYIYTLNAVAAEAKKRWYEYDPDLRAVADPSDETWLALTKSEFEKLKVRSDLAKMPTIDEIFQIVADSAIKNIPIIEKYYYISPRLKLLEMKITIGLWNTTPIEYFISQTNTSAINSLEKVTYKKINTAGKQLILDMINYIVDYWNLRSL